MNKKIVLISLFLLLGLLTSVQGQYYFGRNKIQYHNFRWHILKTKHFDIYFYPEMESLAEIGAYYAEESYKYLQDKFNHNILTRIPLVFYSSHFHFEETNTYPYLISPGLGGFFEFVKGRVVIPCDGSLPRFRETIRHELVHVFQRSYVQRTLKDHRYIQFRTVPLWFTEGLAEYWSEGWSPDAEMVIRDIILNSSLVPIQSMYMINGTYLMYKEGQSILKFIAEEYGEEKILRIMQNVWKSEDFSEILKMTLGKDIKELNEAWIYNLKKSVYPLFEDKDLPRMVATRITEKGFNTLPAFYRDNTTPKVVFIANRDGYTSIYHKSMVSYDEEDPEILIKGERTPENESFHIQKSRLDVDKKGRLAYIAKSGSQDVLYIYHIPEKRVLHEFRLPKIVSLFSPAWSPDGKKIVVAGLDQEGRNDLYIVEIESGSTKRLTTDFYNDQDPDWSPCGRWIVFSSDRTMLGEEGYMNLFLFDLENLKIQYLTFGPYQDQNPTWSPDGDFIAFASDRDGVSNIWLIKKEPQQNIKSDSVQVSNGTPFEDENAALMQLTQFATGGFFPCWTDSSDLLFTGFERVSLHIRWLDNIQNRVEFLPRQYLDPIIKMDGTWTYPVIQGDIQKGKVRYKKKFSLDFAQSQVIQDPIFGTSGGGQLAISDMLGDEQYYFLIYNNAQSSSEIWDAFNIAATRVDLSHRVNYSLGLYRLAGHYYNNFEGYFYERRYGGFGAISYPFNLYERIETSLNVRHSMKDRYSIGEMRNAFLISNFISYTKDNSLWGPTGPLDGGRYNIALGNTVDVLHSNVNFTTVMFDLRKYFRVSYSMAHAVRVWGQFNQGKEPLPFYMGGSWDLRGYSLWSLWGTKLFLISNEFRFPFIDQFYLRFPFGGIGFNSIRGALFVDAGNVWDDTFGDIKGSFGFGLRFRFAGYLVLRLDIGKKTNFKEIYPKTFTQFFFGWDF